MDYIKYKLFLFLILFCTSAVPLEVTVYIPVYEPLSKTISTPISGSSNIIIDRKDLEEYENTPIHDILDLESGIKAEAYTDQIHQEAKQLWISEVWGRKQKAMC